VTMNEAHRSRESARLAAAKNARSRSRSSGRWTVRLSTRTSWRSTGVLELELRHARPSVRNPTRRTRMEWAKDRKARRMLPTSVKERGTGFSTPTGARRSRAGAATRSHVR
jgi:hypothetical protein